MTIMERVRKLRNLFAKRIILISFILTHTIFLEAQQTRSFTKVNFEDTSSIVFLNEQAYQFYLQSENDSCLVYASSALERVEQLINYLTQSKQSNVLDRCKILKVMSLKNIARSLRHNHLKEALDTLQFALQLTQEVGDIKEQALVYSLLAYIYEEAFQPAQAIDYYRRSLELYLKSGDQKGQADQLLYIGINLRYKGNYGDAMENFTEALLISRQIKDSATMVEALLAIGFVYMFVEKYDDAIKAQQDALHIYQDMRDSLGIARIYNDMGTTNMRAGHLELALKQHQAALKIRLNTTDYYYTSASYTYIANIYEELNNLSAAIAHYQLALHYTKLDGAKIGIIHAHLDLGSAYVKNSEPDEAMEQFLMAYHLSQTENHATTEVHAAMKIAAIYLEKKQMTKALFWMQEAEKKSPQPLPVFLQNLHLNMANAYATLGDYKTAFHKLQKYILIKDSVLSLENIEKITTLSNKLEFENKQALQNENLEKILALNQAQIKRQKITRNFSLFGMFVAFILVGVVFIRFIEKKKLNNRLNATLADLKATQVQLVQSEKMASLGELTAGIAHEIQNPLNFVNNFSEVNKELLVELKDEIIKGNNDAVLSIADAVIGNQEKINQHGKRADAIVKSMLQHSRTNSGQKEPTDINSLCDEYLRLAYHGWRVKDKSFNARLETNFDNALGLINVVPQETGRVVLNLINNAFYACSERKKHAEAGYEPKVRVSTQRSAPAQVLITIQDNGIGMSDAIKDKIFLPFFTTKPSGQGTGLGLSLAYDIITKGHRGSIECESTEGTGTTFVIKVPS